MEQTVKNMETKARIKGLPVYRLRGVTTDNVPVVKSTGMWVHYPWLGDDGWCLAVPDQWREAVMTSLGQHDITLEDMSELPKRSNFLFGLGLAGGALMAYVIGLVIAIADNSNSGLAGFIVLAIPFVAIALVNIRSKSAASYGALVKPENEVKRATDQENHDPFMDDWGMAATDIPGSLAYNMWRDRDWD